MTLAMPGSSIPFSARLTVEETALLLALKRHVEARTGKVTTQATVFRLALEALKAVEADNGFELNV